jgi:hypothetical protein
MKKLALVLAFSLGLTACGGGTGSPSTKISPSPTPVAMEVLAPPGPGAPFYSDVQSLLMTSPVVSGANFFVPWSVVDQGPGTSPQYVFSDIDHELQPWILAGKKVNLIVWPVSDTSPNTATPSYVIDQLNSAGPYTVNCTDPTLGAELIPDYFRPEFQTPYKAFLQQVVQHYAQSSFVSSIGYIRIGLARGGETYPALGLESDPVCEAAFTNWGLTSATTGVWTAYINSMLDYEKTLDSPVQLMVGLNSMFGQLQVPDSIAAEAVQNGIGIGSQGLQSSDLTNSHCTADWCALFDRYTGDVPLELQTLTQSDPNGGGQTGSLSILLPFAVENHTTILELYWEDWLTGFDSAYPGYDPAYATTIQNASAGQT